MRKWAIPLGLMTAWLVGGLLLFVGMQLDIRSTALKGSDTIHLTSKMAWVCASYVKAGELAWSCKPRAAIENFILQDAPAPPTFHSGTVEHLPLR